MGSSGCEKQRAMIRMLQHSILQLCNEHVGYSHKLQILGVLCMTIDDDSQEVVIKVNNTLKRVPSQGNGRDLAPAIAPAPIPIPGHTISPGQSQVASFTQGNKHGGLLAPVQNGLTTTVSATPIASPAFVVSPTGLITHAHPMFNSINNSISNADKHNNNSKESIAATTQQKVSTPVISPASSRTNPAVTDLTASSIAKTNTITSPSSKKSVGRKARKPMRVDCVYDEGESVMNDADILTVIPTDPDQIDDVSDEQQKQGEALDATRTPTASPNPSQHSIMRQVLEKGAAVAMALNDSDSNPLDTPATSPFRARSYPAMHSSAASKGSGSASIRALLQAQAQMRQQAKLVPTNGSSPSKSGMSPSRSNTSSPYTGKGIMPILVAPESPISADHANESIANGDTMETEQEEALDFSSGDKELQIDLQESDDEIEVVRSASSSTPLSTADSSVLKVKDEPKDGRESSRSVSRSSDVVPEDLSQSLALSGASVVNQSLNQSLGAGQVLTSVSHSAFPSPYATYAFVESLQGLPQLNYAGLNLSLPSGGFGLSNPINGVDGGVSIQYTPTGPITVGANGQNLSQPARVKDIIMYGGGSPMKKKPKLSKVQREGDYMLDHMAEEARKRRRKSPNDALTAEEIAEYMGASNVPSGRDGGVMFKCKYCSEEIEDLVRYLQHTLTVHNAYICHQCGKSFTTKSSLLRHRPIHTGLRRFACSICKKSFYRKDKCKSHIKRHLGPNDQNVDQYQHIEPVPEMGDTMAAKMAADNLNMAQNLKITDNLKVTDKLKMPENLTMPGKLKMTENLKTAENIHVEQSASNVIHYPFVELPMNGAESVSSRVATPEAAATQYRHIESAAEMPVNLVV